MRLSIHLSIGIFFMLLLGLASCTRASSAVDKKSSEKTRVIVTSDGEIDDQCSIVRFLLYTNEWDVEGIITSSSQYHWQGHAWPGDDWIEPYLDAYEEVYPNLMKHDAEYPTPEYLRSRTVLGNVKAEGEMDEITPGSELIVKVLLDKSDDRPIWIQAWGGTNTIARALKTIQEKHPGEMEYVANKMRFFFIWEQDSTYQEYILPNWGKYEILTIISDQFEAIAYRWNKIQPEELHTYYQAPWMKEYILEDHGPLCSIYPAHKEGDKPVNEGDPAFREGDFHSEGDSPAFIHTIKTGLRSMESPDWGGWGGRYVKVRHNTWLDPAPYEGYTYPEGRYYTSSVWGRASLNLGTSIDDTTHVNFFKPIWRWSDAFQNDFASRADWCVKSYKEANHPPSVELNHPLEITAGIGQRVNLSGEGITDPDGDKLTYRWFHYPEAGTSRRSTSRTDSPLEIEDADQADAWFMVPEKIAAGDLHIILAVTDQGLPPLTRYKRVIVSVH
jgi:hypothetical protein